MSEDNQVKEHTSKEKRGLDATHDSDLRGEHRYDDAHQTEAERQARQERDDLKQRLAGRITRPSPSPNRALLVRPTTRAS